MENQKQRDASPQMRKSTLNRAVKRAQSRLPSRPRKRKNVVQELALTFSPESLVPAAKRREANELSSETIASVVGFDENDDISSQAF